MAGPATDFRIEDVCSLSPEALEERRAAIRREIAPRIVAREELANGLACAFEASPAMRVKLEQLVALERQCCGGLAWRVEETAGGARLRLVIEGVDPRSGFFDALGSAPERTAGAGGAVARVAKAGGIGAGIAFFVCCLLPMGLAARGGAALAAPFARLDQPAILGAGALAAMVPAWWWLRRRDARASAAGCGRGC